MTEIEPSQKVFVLVDQTTITEAIVLDAPSLGGFVRLQFPDEYIAWFNILYIGKTKSEVRTKMLTYWQYETDKEK